MDGDRDTETVDGDDSELSISVSVGDVSVEVSGRADKVEVWYDVVKNDVLEPLDEETIRAAAELTSPTAATHYVGSGATGENEMQTDGSTADSNDETTSDNETSKNIPERTLPEYYNMAGGSDLTKKDRALVVGWFLTQYEDMDNFSSNDVEQKANEAQIGLGSNVSRDLGRHVGDGHMVETNKSESPSTYQPTITGREYVQEELLQADE
jgi:hypothetical protein